MAAKYSDTEITELISEKKVLGSDYRNKMKLREKRGHKEQEFDFFGENGNQFRLILRQNSFNALDFSIILAHCPAGSNQIFRLRRYNGKSHEHTNGIESDTFYDYHIHSATERYQELGAREDTYAEPTQRYSDFTSAVKCLFVDCNFDLPRNPQKNLFEEV
ncbi:hypothetical protein LLH00_07810 [bacterium]|nr:hypothetical protein [bacterium]